MSIHKKYTWITMLLFTLSYLFSLSGCIFLEEEKIIEIPLTSVSIIDGDTIKAKIDGRVETVRFLLIDTPETNHPSLGEQPLGEEAKNFTHALITKAKNIKLEYDKSKRDKYGRLLAYMYVDEKSLQEELIRNGFARVAYVYEPNVKYESRFRKIEKEAKKDKSGIWQWDDYVQNNGFNSKQIVDRPSQTKSASNTMHPFIASKNSDVYHPSNCYIIQKIKPDNRIYFASEQDAISSGRKRSKVAECW